MNADKILQLSDRYPGREPLVYLAALSIRWREPRNVDTINLLYAYRIREYSFDALRETVLQLFLLAGFQASLEAAFQIEEVYGHGMQAGGDSATVIDAIAWYARGQELQASVYRGNVQKLRENLNRISPELSVWTVLVGYGMVMSRPGLPQHWRELLEIAVLAVQGFDRQLHSHLRGALNIGASIDEVELILDVSRVFTVRRRHAANMRMWRMIRSSFCQNGI